MPHFCGAFFCISFLVVMTNDIKYFKIGKLAASHGLNGELVLAHSLGAKARLDKISVLFIEESTGKFLPYFIEKIAGRNATEAIVKIEDLSLMEQARRLTPKEVWLTEAEFNVAKEQAAPIGLLGYEMMQAKKSLGEIVEVIEQPHQLLCAIILQGKEALIPVHEANLQKIDHKAKKVWVDIPEGLLEIYL